MKALARLFVVTGLLIFLSQAVFAAETTEKYTVQPSDTLWDLSATYHKDPLKWAEVLGANPFLKEKGRVVNHSDGRVIVLIRPGEELAGLNRIGVKAEMVPFSSLWPAPTTVPPSASAPTAATERAESVIVNLGAGTATVDVGPVLFYWTPVLGIPLWFLALVAAIVLALLWVLYRDGLLSRSRQSAGLAGPPIVQGGISTSQPDAIENRFERIAERHYGERNPSADLSADRPERIGAIESGFLSGRGTVQYRDHGESRRLNHEPAYRARFRFPDGTEEDLYFLQLCANDVRFGTRYRGFRWETERIVVPLPTATPATVPAPATASTPTPLRVVKPTEPAKLTTVSVGGTEVTLPEGSSVRLETDGRIVVSIATACEMTIGPAPTAETQAATA